MNSGLPLIHLFRLKTESLQNKQLTANDLTVNSSRLLPNLSQGSSHRDFDLFLQEDSGHGLVRLELSLTPEGLLSARIAVVMSRLGARRAAEEAEVEAPSSSSVSSMSESEEAESVDLEEVRGSLGLDLEGTVLACLAGLCCKERACL